MKTRFLFCLIAIVTITTMVLAACAPAPAPTAAPVQTEAPAEAPAATEAPAPTEPPAPEFLACQVTDTGGIDDKSFNATAWKGVTDAMDQLGVEGKYLESQQQTDYEKNINAFIDEGCKIIVTVGFLLGDATKAAAEKNPEAKFSIVDFAYDPTIPNVLGQVFATDQAGFLAGYTAAGVTKTGKVGTFGGIQIPPVTVFMDGFSLGVDAYNEKHGTNVEVLGWDPATQTGLFTGNFESTDDGRTMGESLMDEGADIIMPVAGPVGLGTAAAAKERGEVYIIGVDSDWYNTAPDFKDIMLTSVLKNMDVTTFDAIKAVQDGTFEGGVTVGTLDNGGVGLAPFHDLEAMVPAELVAELDAVKADIVAGKVATAPTGEPAPVPVSESIDEIAAAAKEGGQVISYGMSDDWVNLGNIWKAIEDKYGITHTDTDMTSAEQITRLLAERDAPVMDVADIGYDALGKLLENNLAMEYRNTYWDKIPENFKDPDGRWAIAYWGAISFLVNKDLVTNIPQTWDDLLKPEYKDMICSRDPRTSTYATGSVLAAALAHGGGEDNVQPGLDFFKQLRESGNWREGVVLNVASVQKGECPISIVYDFDGFNKRDATGLPLEVVIPKDGTVGMLFAEYISDVAPHPNAAKAANDFLFSDEGQIMLATGYAHPGRSDVKLPDDVAAKLLPESAYPNLHFPSSLENFMVAVKNIVDGWNQIVGQ